MENPNKSLIERIRTEGLEKAYEGLLRVLDDPKAGASATASAANTIFRAGGLLDNADDDEVEPHQMTAEQIQKAIDRLRRKRGEDTE